MKKKNSIENIQNYFSKKFSNYGPTPMGLDWNSEDSQTIRFDQISKIIDPAAPYTIIDYGCGYGAFFDYLSSKKHHFDFFGYDIVSEMIETGIQIHEDAANCHLTSNPGILETADYVVESGIFNIKLNATNDDWTRHVLDTLEEFNRLSRKGFSFNMLTKYSDKEFMREDLYYADPCFYFDHCKTKYSRNVALLHDYEIYDFTILVRK
jgi:SAM-dependent methyltransferase